MLDAIAIEKPRCPDHPERESIGTCARCGRFMCEGCAAEKKPLLCASCRTERIEVVTFGVPPLTFSSGTSSAVRMLAGALHLVVPVALLSGLIRGALFIGAASLHVSHWAMDVATVMLVGLVGILTQSVELILIASVARGVPLSILSATRIVRVLAGRVIGTWVRVAYTVVWGLRLLAIPGLLDWARYGVAVPVALLEPKVDKPLARARQLSQGRLWPIFGLQMVGLFVWVLAMMVGVVPAGLQGLRPGPTAHAFNLLLNVAMEVGSLASVAISAAIYGGLRAARISEQPSPQQAISRTAP